MTEKRFRIFAILIILSVITLPVFAQRSGALSGSGSSSQSQGQVLSVNSNVRGASVVVKTAEKYPKPVAEGTAPFNVQLSTGAYIVTVSAPGYDTEEQSVNFRNSMTLNFNLNQNAPVQVSLSVRSNVRDAKIVITGGGISGQLIGAAPFTAQLAKGNYRISVSAPGYLTTQQQLSLTSSRTLNINLDAETYSLSVTSNVTGAKVFIRGENLNGQLTGTTDMTSVLPAGTYVIKVNAPGYFAEEKTVVFNQSSTIYFDLRARTARLEVIIPNNILDYSMGNPAAQIKIFDNGSKINGTSTQLTPGQHTIRVTSGAFAAQQTINVRAGDSYRMELNFGFAMIKE